VSRAVEPTPVACESAFMRSGDDSASSDEMSGTTVVAKLRERLAPEISAVLKKKTYPDSRGRCSPKRCCDLSPEKLRCLLRSQWNWKRAHFPSGLQHAVMWQGVEGRCSRSMLLWYIPDAATRAHSEREPSTRAACGLLYLATWSKLVSWSFR
jgi:hypothetical protein